MPSSRCFCHSTSEPRQIRLGTTHSCDSSCSRVRESGCGHPCPLQCHPGPCPPCQVTTRPECYCPLKEVLAFRCGIDATAGRDLSCGKFVEERSVARNMFARGRVIVESVTNARLKKWLNVGVGKKRRRLDVEKGRNGSVLLKDNLLGWADSAAITSVKGA